MVFIYSIITYSQTMTILSYKLLVRLYKNAGQLLSTCMLDKMINVMFCRCFGCILSLKAVSSINWQEL